MSEIKRYAVPRELALNVVECANGDLMKYRDHLARIAQLEADLKLGHGEFKRAIAERDEALIEVAQLEAQAQKLEQAVLDVIANGVVKGAWAHKRLSDAISQKKAGEA